MKVTDQERDAFERLQGNTLIHECFKRNLAEVQDTLVRANDPVTVRQLQGGARQLMEILSLIDGSSRHNATPGKRR